MAEISAALVKQLRERTGAGMMECKKALQAAKAIWPKPKSCCASAASRRPARRPAAPPSRVWSAPTFTPADSSACWWKSTANPISWRAPTISRNWCTISPCTSPPPIRSSSARKTSRQARSIKRRTSSARARLNEGKPEKMVDKIVEGRMNKFYEEICLLRAALRQGNDHHRRSAHQDQDRQAGREYLGLPLRPLQSRRDRGRAGEEQAADGNKTGPIATIDMPNTSASF